MEDMDSSPVLASKKSKKNLRKRRKLCQKLKFDHEVGKPLLNDKDDVAELEELERIDKSREEVGILLSKSFANKKSVTADEELSLTQAIQESGISNSQIASAMDDLINNMEQEAGAKIENDVKYFDKDEIQIMQEKCGFMINLCTELENRLETVIVGKKRKSTCDNFNSRDDFEFFKCKKFKFNHHPCQLLKIPNSKNVIHEFSEEENQLITNENEKSVELLIKSKVRSTISKNFEVKTDQSFISDQLNEVNFQSASGKVLNTSKNCLIKAQNMLFDSIENSQSELNVAGFSSASGKSLKTSKSDLNKAREIFQNSNSEDSNLGPLVVDNNKKSSNLLQKKVNETVLVKEKSLTDIGFSSARGKPISASKFDLEKAEELFNFDNNIETDFVKPVKNFFKCDNKENISCGFSSASGKSINASKSTIFKAEKLFDNLDNSEKLNNSDTYPKNPDNFNNSNSIGKKPDSLVDFRANSSSKKRLGVSGCRQLIPTNNNRFLKAQRLFDGILSSPENNKPFKTSTPNKTSLSFSKKVPFNDTITPIKAVDSSSISNVSDLIDSTVTLNYSAANSTKTFVENNDSYKERFVFSKSVHFDVQSTLNQFKKERELLLEKLHVLDDKIQNISVLNGTLTNKKFQIYGNLYLKKESQQRKSLQEFVNYSKPGENLSCNDKNNKLFEICPRNATEVHFTSDKTIRCEDGAVLIPTTNNTIGLPQFEFAFKAMPSVDSKLIHRNWISNHYKWIVWKLASYERMFPEKFSGIFSPTQIIEQLKYRYDKEIEKAQRPALRKICETDDVPQRRMVLCVAHIYEQFKHKIDLELTDGWYSLRTKLDDALCDQVRKGNISIGTKLVVCNAEIVNLHASHPLDISDLVHLNINFNCTRRAAWHCKLGYQRCNVPFPIKIQSISNTGGNIGRIEFFIAKIYPLKFKDKIDCNVWRNERAEERCLQERQKERCKKIDEIQQKVYKELQMEQSTSFKYDLKNISNIQCPETLFELIANSRDPDSILENLSSSQKESLSSYQGSRNSKFQAKFDKYVSEMGVAAHDSVPLLEMSIVDSLSEDNRLYTLRIWRPNENHLAMFKELSFFRGYNFLPRLPFALNSTSKSMFEEIPLPVNSDQFLKFARKFIPINNLRNVDLSNNEFDTIGLVVKTDTDGIFQSVWLTDLKGNLLLITIHLGSAYFSLPHNLKRGVAVYVCNLKNATLKNGKYIEVKADLCTSFMTNPQEKQMKKHFVDFSNNLPKNLDNILKGCDGVINSSKMISFDEIAMADDEEAAFNNNCLTATDIALSLIDMDKFI